MLGKLGQFSIDIKLRIDNIKEYKNVINTILQARGSVINGSGQAKRNAYEIQKDGCYGALLVGFGQLLNYIVLHASQTFV